MKKIIFVGFTPYHLINSIYYAMKLKNIEECEKILIWHDYANYKIDFSDIRKNFNHIYIVPYYDDVNKIQKQFLKRRYTGQGLKKTEIGQYLEACQNDVILVCFSDVHELTNKVIQILAKKKNRILLVEEGIGLYSMDYIKLPLRSKFINMILGIGTEKIIGGNKNISAVILKHPEWVEKDKFSGKILIQQNIMYLDKEFISKLSFLKEKVECANRSVKKMILWLGDPIEDIGGDNSEEVDIILKLSENVKETHMILIKPHPREKQDKYKKIENDRIKILDLEGLTWIPVEIIVKYLNFKTVVTPVSSAAYNIYKTKNCIQVIYLYNILHGLKFDKAVMEPIISEENVYCPLELEEATKLIQNERHIETKEINITNRDEDINFLKSLLGDEKNG